MIRFPMSFVVALVCFPVFLFVGMLWFAVEHQPPRWSVKFPVPDGADHSRLLVCSRDDPQTLSCFDFKKVMEAATARNRAQDEGL